MWLQKKLFDEKKKDKKLMIQKIKCLEDDRLANDEERINYEESVERMKEAMDIMKHKEGTNYIKEYISDWKTVCKNEKKMSTQEKIADKNDQYFKDSVVHMNDFFLLRFSNYMNNQIGNMAEEKITIKDMVDLKCRAVVEEEDLDIICGKEKISGKE